MGIFDRFRRNDSSGSDKEIARLTKMLSSKLSMDPDRHDALERLSAMGTAAAAEALLGRFSWNLDPSIRDQEEKATALAGIVRAGEAAVQPIRAHCGKAESLTWPIKALREILKGDELQAELIRLLSQFDTEYVRNPEPKVHLIQALEEFASDETRNAVLPFLQDVSEMVRFAAVTCVFSVGHPTMASPLGQALVREESLRVKNRIAQGLSERRYEIAEDARKALGAALPSGFALRDGFVVARG